ncbi:serine/threonine-protein kinase PCRK1-like [Rhododendron vialii]|uniref:serine/threonine-protein kinase PCRK1-like n=1 Tax=Rhododendron vialii TaxID=182163 RepID=UPI00265F3130|nr:serine/threonine-protein kinase PCRK1-like [Rhododendron vialii]XP_058207984.1 serine/threonine-protein kinase PCRK1-like [Rhododendron vialii]
MMCFQFYCGEKKDEQKTTKSMSVRSSNSTLTELEMRRSGSEFNSQNVSDMSTESVGRSTFPSLSQRPSNLRVFTYAEMKTATRNFNRTTKIGEGGFGCVYKGAIKSSDDPQGKLDVAVKQLGKRGLQGHKEWVTEVNVLGVVEHPNLVKLVGYCAEDDERGIQRILVYEYMPNKSVEDHLSPRSETPLPWAMRLKIAQDAACGLAYLHEGMDFQIIFRDFKSSNILLDEQWNAKLSDFGLARLGPLEGETHVSTAVVGTLGYAAPEYIQTGHLTSRSDVWSYGVFLYELITGRRPMDRNRPKNEQKLLDWVRPHLADSKKFQQILDPKLEWNGLIKSAQRLAVVANRCLTRNSKSRPKMSEVLEMVNRIVEPSQEIGCGSQPPVRTIWENKANGKRSIMDMRMGESSWLHRMWSSKVVRTC